MASITGQEAEALPIPRIIRAILATKLLGQFHDNWSLFAIYLDTPSERVKKIRDDQLHNKITLMDALRELIEAWYSRCGSAATIGKLIDAFEAVDLNCFGEALRHEFNLPALMTGKKHCPIKNVIPDVLKYYVQRTLITRDRLTEKLFERSSDIFLFTGIERSVLSQFVSSTDRSISRLTDTTTSQLNNRDPEVKYMILDMPNHFSKIQTSSESSVHHIKYEDKKLVWVKSIGSLDSVRRFIWKYQVQLSESDFLERLSSPSVPDTVQCPVVISDTPGMGKSEILKQIARNISTLLHERIIIFQEFPKFISIVNRLISSKEHRDLNMCIQAALQELAYKFTKSDLGSKILNSKLESKEITIELLLDGYDELSAAAVKTANDILKEIHSSFKAIRLWVTTRPHLLKNVENMLAVLGYTIRSFNTADQENFLASYWSRDQDLPMDRLSQYATNCLNQIKSTLSAKEQDIAGIPLQCRMIGEVYEEEATDYSQNDVTLAGSKITIKSITDLYKLTIENRLHKYQSTYRKFKLTEQELTDMHVQLSLKLIFPTYFKIVKSKFRKVEMEDVLNVGILESKGSDSEPKFIHRTFAEYFVSLFVVNVLCGKYTNSSDDNGDNGNISELHFKEVFAFKGTKNADEFKYPVICFFINSLLSGLEVQPNISLPFVNLFNVYLTIKNIARACINGDFINIFRLFDRFNLFKTYEMHIFDEELTLNAIKKSSRALIEIVMDKFKLSNKFDINFQTKALRAAVERGEFSPVEFLLNDEKMQSIMEDSDNWERMQILHCCVENSKENSEEVIRQKIQVIQRLVKINKLLLEEKNNQGNTPLVCKNVHIRLLIKLIGVGANVLATNNKKDTILHCMHFTPGEYHDLLTSIKKDDIVQLVDEEGDKQYTPLSRLIKTMDPKEDTFTVFKNAGANFNTPHIFRGYPPLAIAVKHGRNDTTLRKLIECGSDVRWRGKDNCNLLHVASEYCNINAISLLREYGVDSNALDKDLNTPLHIGARINKFTDCLKIIKTLIECGGNTTANKEGDTFLHNLFRGKITASEFHDVVQLLIQLDYLNNLVASDYFGCSSLMVAVANVDIDEETLSLLQSQGIDLLKPTTGATKETYRMNQEDYLLSSIKRLKRANMTLLHAASLQWNYKVIPFLLKSGLNVNEKDSSLFTSLHYASGYFESNWESDRGNCLVTLTILIENGADVYATAHDGETFLHNLIRGLSHRMSSDQFHKIIEYLVTNNHTKLFSIRGKNGVTPLHLAVQMRNINDATISFLNMSGVKFDFVDDDGESILVHAVRGGKSVEFLETLIRCGANAKQINKNGQNLLHIVPKRANIDVIKFILSLGIDVNGIDSNGNTPLHLYFQKYWWSIDSDLQLIKILIENGVSVTKLNEESQSPFSIAKRVFSDKKELLQLLSKQFAEEINNQDENGNTQLHTAVSNNNFVLVKELVKMEADVNLQNKKSETPLHLASSINDKSKALKIIKLLIESNADLVMKDENDDTFLHILLTPNTNLSPAQFHDLAEYLIGKGHPKSLETAGWYNGTAPIHLALLNLDLEESTLTLLASHVNWNLVDYHGRTPLFYITGSKNNSALLPRLVQLKLGADYNRLDNYGSNLIHTAAEYGNLDALKYFISLGLPVNGSNLDGDTPLHVALLRGWENVPEIIGILAEAGAESHLKNNSGQTPFLLLLAQKNTAPSQVQIASITDASTNTD